MRSIILWISFQWFRIHLRILTLWYGKGKIPIGKLPRIEISEEEADVILITCAVGEICNEYKLDKSATPIYQDLIQYMRTGKTTDRIRRYAKLRKYNRVLLTGEIKKDLAILGLIKL